MTFESADCKGTPKPAAIGEMRITVVRNGKESLWHPAPMPNAGKFAQAEYDDSGWRTIPVPANWEMHGFSTATFNQPDDAVGLYRRWVEVPAHLAKKNRFVVRVAGDSMEPALPIGSLAIFEYHRTPRRDPEIVIANLPEFGPGETGTEAVKRITQDAGCWIFQSDNPLYQPIRVSKNVIAHPILGTMVEVLK